MAVFGVLAAVCLLSVRRIREAVLFPLSVTQELKGFAILLVLCSHIGNFLVADHRFLAPLSGLSAVGVDMFLLLSGYGLTVSNLRKSQSIRQFYGRILKLLIPFWIVLGVFSLLDVFVLHIHYGSHTLFEAAFGIFLTSNLSQDFNAPLWFMTVILFYYLLFPLVRVRKHFWVSALVLLAVGIAMVLSKPSVLGGVMFLYQVHYVAFPLGMLLAWLANDPHSQLRQWSARYTGVWRGVQAWAARQWRWLIPIVVAVLIGALVVLNPHSHNAQGAIVQQLVDITAVLLLILLFIVKRINIAALRLLGVYSFEIYLVHWPLIARYNFLYTHVPAWLATLCYLIILIGLGWMLQRLSGLVASRITKPAAKRA